MVYYDGFDPFDLDEQQFEQSDSDNDLGETDSGKKTSFGFGPHPKFSGGDEKYALNQRRNGDYTVMHCGGVFSKFRISRAFGRKL